MEKSTKLEHSRGQGLPVILSVLNGHVGGWFAMLAGACSMCDCAVIGLGGEYQPVQQANMRC